MNTTTKKPLGPYVLPTTKRESEVRQLMHDIKGRRTKDRAGFDEILHDVVSVTSRLSNRDIEELSAMVVALRNLE